MLSSVTDSLACEGDDKHIVFRLPGQQSDSNSAD